MLWSKFNESLEGEPSMNPVLYRAEWKEAQTFKKKKVKGREYGNCIMAPLMLAMLKHDGIFFRSYIRGPVSIYLSLSNIQVL